MLAQQVFVLMICVFSSKNQQNTCRHALILSEIKDVSQGNGYFPNGFMSVGEYFVVG